MEAQMLALIPAYALADSFAGGSLGQWAKRLDERLPGRAAFWAGVLVSLAGLVTIGPWGAAAGVAWWLYRIAGGWKLLGGSATPVGGRELVGTLLRHLIAFLALPVAYWAGKPVLPAALAFGAFAVGATVLAAVYGQRKKDAVAAGEAIPADDPFNRFLELCRGCAYGLAVALSLGGGG